MWRGLTTHRRPQLYLYSFVTQYSIPTHTQYIYRPSRLLQLYVVSRANIINKYGERRFECHSYAAPYPSRGVLQTSPLAMPPPSRYHLPCVISGLVSKRLVDTLYFPPWGSMGKSQSKQGGDTGEPQRRGLHFKGLY